MLRTRSSRGVLLAVHDLGGDGEDVLLVCHATGFCARAYEPLVPVLARRFRVWAVDFRGHGDSTAPDDGDFDWGGMGDDVLASVDAIGASSIYGFGHSMGGAALLLAETARPGVLRRAFLYEPIVLPATMVAQRAATGPNPMGAAARRRRPSFASRGDALLRYATRPSLNVLRADALAAYVEHGFRDGEDGTVWLKCEPQNEARTFEDARVSLGDVGGVQTPLTVAMGDREAASGPASWAPLVAEALPGGELLRYRHLGHFGPLQDPDTVAEDVVRLAG